MGVTKKASQNNGKSFWNLFFLVSKIVAQNSAEKT